jgi:hypothetical protein
VSDAFFVFFTCKFMLRIRFSHYILLGVALYLQFGNVLAQQPMLTLNDLAADPGWHRLLHYEQSMIGLTKRSAVISPDFFLAPDGATNPLAELKATISALKLPPLKDMDNHAQCKFPARYQWLVDRLGASQFNHLEAQCDELDLWTRNNSVRSISVVLASGYLANPASYYGHTLLKLNFENEVSGSYLIDTSVNFGAIVPDNENPFKYIAKGILGGYDGGFSHVGFYFHSHNYGDHELRDLWEYKLDLNQTDVDFIVKHSWEVLGKRYTYYFFDRNCALRIAEILEVIGGIKVLPPDSLWTIPQHHIQVLAQATYHDRPLVSEVKFHPSRQTRFYNKVKNLTSNEYAEFTGLTTKQTTFDSVSFTSLPVKSQQAIVDSAIDYYQFVGSPLETAPQELKNAYTTALSVRYKLPPGVVPLEVTIPQGPHTGRAPSWFQLAALDGSAIGKFQTLRIRPAYYDQLDSDSGHISNSKLTMADLTLGIKDSEVWLKHLDFISIESSSPNLTGLPGDSIAAWKMRLGMDELDQVRHNTAILKLSGDIGLTRQATSWGFLGAYIGATLQSDSKYQGLGHSHFSLQAVVKPKNRFSGKFSYEQRFPFNRQLPAYEESTLELRFAFSKNSDLRLSYLRNQASEVGLGFGFYW